MKKNISINLFGQLYAIDEDAYELLDSYLRNTRAYFGKREGGEEIADDIEHRVAEILAEMKQEGLTAIDRNLVESIIHRIGNPEEMDGESADGNAGPAGRSGSGAPQADPAADGTQAASSSTTGTPDEGRFRRWVNSRKFFRNPNDKMVAGVMSGLCSYFGATDPLPWRIAMVILCIFSLSTFGIIYLLLWLFVPEARTAEERLQMQGRPVNTQTLSEEIVNGAKRFNQSFNTPETRSKARGLLATLLTIIVWCLKVGALFLLCLILFCIVSLVFNLAIFAVGGCGVLTEMARGNLFFSALTTGNVQLTLWLAALSGLIAVGIATYAIARAFSNARPLGAKSKVTLTVAGIVSFAACCSFMIFLLLQFTDHNIRRSHFGRHYEVSIAPEADSSRLETAPTLRISVSADSLHVSASADSLAPARP